MYGQRCPSGGVPRRTAATRARPVPQRAALCYGYAVVLALAARCLWCAMSRCVALRSGALRRAALWCAAACCALVRCPRLRSLRLSSLCFSPLSASSFSLFFFLCRCSSALLLAHVLLSQLNMAALKGKTAIVTGSTSGIGLGVATALAGCAPRAAPAAAVRPPSRHRLDCDLTLAGHANAHTCTRPTQRPARASCSTVLAIPPKSTRSAAASASATASRSRTRRRTCSSATRSSPSSSRHEHNTGAQPPVREPDCVQTSRAICSGRARARALSGTDPA